MSKFLQGYIVKEQDDSFKLFIRSLHLGADDFKIDTKMFVLPNDRSKLINLTDEIYRQDAPQNIDKTTFRNQIVDYILNMQPETIDVANVNVYLDNQFKNQLNNLLGANISNIAEATEEIFSSEGDEARYTASNGSLESGAGDDPTSFSYSSVFEETAYNMLESGLISQEEFNLIMQNIPNDPDIDISNLPLEENISELMQYVNSQIDYFDPDGDDNFTPANPLIPISDTQSSVGSETVGDNQITRSVEEKPTVGGQRPVVDQSNLSIEQTMTMVNAPTELSDSLKGFEGDRLIEPVPKPIYYAGDSFLASENNSGIICSRDEHYRVRAHTRSGAVYIYAGRDVNNMEPPNEIAGAGATASAIKVVKQPNDLVKDAAYIYVSQKADVDSLLRVAPKGTYGKRVQELESQSLIETRQGLSLVAMKADDIVLMSRVSGIRLIAGSDSKNSKGEEQVSKFGIDLIGGSNDADLQPLVKGENLKTYLENLSKVVDGLRAVLVDFITSQLKFNSAIGKHKHYDPFLILLGFMSGPAPGVPGNPLKFNNGKNFNSREAVEATSISGYEGVRQQHNIVNIMQNRVNNDNNAFSPIGTYRILSSKNRTN